MMWHNRYVKFGDDYKLSIISEKQIGLFEVAVLYRDKLVHMPGISDPGDTVTRFRTQHELEMIMKKMLCVTGKHPIGIKN